MKVKEFEQNLKSAGWTLDRTGKHKVYKHPDREEIVVVPNHPNHGIAKGTLESIRKIAGWK